MNDISGSRFLRMAGSDGFQRELNRSSQPVGSSDSNISGDFSTTSVPGSNQGAVGSISSGSADYSMFTTPDTNNSSSLMGPGAFDRQVQREKSLMADSPGFEFGTNMVSNRANQNAALQSGGASDGSDIAMKYIRNAALTNPVNIEALDKSIRSRPLYHEAKSELEGLKTFGDRYRYSREQLPEWQMPTPMGPSDKADIDGLYSKSRDDINSVKIGS